MVDEKRARQPVDAHEATADPVGNRQAGADLLLGVRDREGEQIGDVGVR